MRAREIMSSPAVTTEPGTPVREAVALLVQHGFAGLPVVDEQNRVVGLFTEYDALRGARRQERVAVTVGDVMTSPVEVVSPETRVTEIGRRMLADRLRCLPVVADGVVVGVISRRDLLQPLVRHDDAIAAQLRALLTDYSGHRGRWSVEVVGGAVTVSGTFADEAERAVITALARTVPGVSEVDCRAEHTAVR
ncbi:CBS domain-containing protein [Amycolatopsis sp. NPDC059027]|uniref:CBS domain-containing protein n=1 Tax=unclassified Amycolatopsis TaxID=2618356 RepID=UPI003670D856